MLPLVLVAITFLAPFPVCYLGARKVGGDAKIGRLSYLIRLVLPWAMVMTASYYMTKYMIAAGGYSSSNSLAFAAGLIAFECAVYGYTGFLMARRLNDIGTERYRWLAIPTGFPMIGLLVPLVIGFLPRRAGH